MNCSGKFFVPIVICGRAPGVAVVTAFFEPPPSPQPASSAMSRAASAAMVPGLRISGYGRLVACGVGRRRLHRQREAERAALARLALGPDPAAVLLDDPLAHSEADAGSRIGALAVQAVERLEDLLRLARLHPDAVVTDREPPRAIDAVRLHLHVRIAL